MSNFNNKVALILSISLFMTAIAVLQLAPTTAFCADQAVKIGVLANRGEAEAFKMWSATAEYLNANIPGYSFTIVPLMFDRVNPSVRRGEVDFILTNTSIYVELETLYGISRIVTLNNKTTSGGCTVFGGVIFCRADQADIKSLNDLKKKSFLAVNEWSLGGWHAAWRELKDRGIDPFRDFSSLNFTQSHDAVVKSVLERKADAGTVRTDTIEHLSRMGAINLRDLRILNSENVEGFPFALSTRLYPEWPFAKLKHTSDSLAQKVGIALLRMRPESRAAQLALIIGWTIPLDYQPVHEMMKELRLGPYENYGKVTLSSAVRQYWYWVVLGFLVVILMAVATLYVLRLNKTLVLSERQLQEAQEGLKARVQERENLIVDLQNALTKVKLLSGLLPICASCKKVRDDKGYWTQIEAYISEHSEAEFSHGYCPECAEKKFKELERFRKERK